MSEIKYIITLLLISFSVSIHSAQLEKSAVNEFIMEMAAKHQFNATDLDKIFQQANKSTRILEAISRPAEALPWYKYRNIFIQPGRIENGVKFMQDHAGLLAKAREKYGVPPEIITAIIGVETGYGSNKGKDRVIDALSTLAFHYPKRSSFFRKELEQFLLLTREQEFDPLSLLGSYAGAMGMPQFIPSSYRHYAIDFDHDGRIDIWDNPADVIGSVANYFNEHGWTSGEKITFRATVTDDGYKNLLISDLKPTIDIEQAYKSGILPITSIQDGAKVKVMQLEGIENDEIWLGLDNFYVITRYNHSHLYAMAVFQLSEEIMKRHAE